MKLGELIDALVDAKDTIYGVSHDTEVEIRLPGSQIEARVDDVYAVIRVKPGGRSAGSLIIEGVET